MFKVLTKDQAKSIVEDLVSQALKRTKQELLGENEELLDRLVRQYRSKIARFSWKKSQQWCKWSDNGPVLMPDYTRIYYRKGTTEVLLQEFPPQIRFLKFRGSIAKRSNASDVLSEADFSKSFNYSLALPYVVFLFKYIDGSFSEVKCVFNDRPLRNLEERPLRPYLSNIDSNLSVCLGTSFDRSQLEKDNISQQSALVLSHFWHSSFSDEWSSHYWAYKSHFEQKDKRLSSLENWQESGVDNPLFVIENVNWLPHSEENFGDMIVRMFENDKENHQLNEELYHELVDDFLRDVVKTLNENIDAVNEKTSNNVIDSLAEKLVQKVKEV